MKRINDVQVLPGHKLQLRFDDGVAGEVDLSTDAGKGIFGPWRDPGHFASVKIAHRGRALEWPGDIDLCADALYLEISGQTVEELFGKSQHESTHA
jgi:hypothetical protein